MCRFDPGQFVRCVRGPFSGMTGTCVNAAIGRPGVWWVRLSASWQVVGVHADELRPEQRTSELATRERSIA